jgi:hypothetical protein
MVALVFVRAQGELWRLQVLVVQAVRIHIAPICIVPAQVLALLPQLAATLPYQHRWHL